LNEIWRDILVAPTGYRSPEAGVFVAQLDDQSRRLEKDTRGLTPEALVWQPAPGMNTIGMLLAHIAIVEVYWTQVGPLGLTRFETDSVLGIDLDHGDGMPMAAGGLPPATLAGKDLAYYDDLLARARAHSKKAFAALTAADLDREVVRRRADGSVREVVNVRWILYHMVEHQAGHYYQINLLRHQHRLAGIEAPGV
jgi:uncharacterized damage-inducible protein DinB